MLKDEKGWEIDESQYLDNLISGNLEKTQEKRKFVITSHRVRTLSQPKIVPSSIQSCRKHMISRSQIQTAKQNLQFNFVILDQILQRKRSNHLSHLSQLSFSPTKQSLQFSSQNSFTKNNSKCNIVNMSNLLLNSPKTIQRSQIQLSQVLGRVYK
ncbi:unnamed protein product (macronuclear) [Paramecium tetraurelia]|uniref:Uncharacterized protein n=1 Tax=Paramecium tetraurelia TaxID=5888 RepID=A0BPR2_PARTE|nr:uncharacterized protein GSPATT00005279001 [Paramecium tetraurelia]CAK60529.1 unnamed protein product [Paramecium tetraurelia]|eukprot:XP_001427927.1 hypothetical protein (macronuclear) [Paramecium tetraurelia strain d4-2]